MKFRANSELILFYCVCSMLNKTQKKWTLTWKCPTGAFRAIFLFVPLKDKTGKGISERFWECLKVEHISYDFSLNKLYWATQLLVTELSLSWILYNSCTVYRDRHYWLDLVISNRHCSRQRCWNRPQLPLFIIFSYVDEDSCLNCLLLKQTFSRHNKYKVSQKTGPPTIFWHNFAKTSRLWTIFVEKIKKIQTTILPKKLGVGREPPA